MPSRHQRKIEKARARQRSRKARLRLDRIIYAVDIEAVYGDSLELSVFRIGAGRPAVQRFPAQLSPEQRAELKRIKEVLLPNQQQLTAHPFDLATLYRAWFEASPTPWGRRG